MNACEYLARIGFKALLGTPSAVEDEDDPACVEIAKREDHRKVRELLLSPLSTLQAGDGVKWIRKITWPDRVPGLKTWAGQVTLGKIIKKAQKSIRDQEPDDLFSFRCPLKGSSGIDSLSCTDSIDVGFSIDQLDMPVIQRPALELLAMYGLETVPIVSFGYRICGFVFRRNLCRFAVEDRTGGYYHRWGQIGVKRLGRVAAWVERGRQ